MNQHKIAIATFTALALSVLAFSAAAAEFVTNGSFETTTHGAGQLGYNTNATGWSVPAPNGSYTFLFTPGSADTTGVTGQWGNLGLWGPGNGSNNGLTSTSPDGGNYIASDGDFQRGAVSQNITGLVVGDHYSLSFWWAGVQQSTFNGPTTEGWNVSLGSATQSTGVVSLASHGFSGWQQETFTYTATSSSEMLSFLAYGTPGGQPPFSLLDGVSLTGPTTATPLPAALFFVAPALAGVFGFSRRKQKKA